MRLAILGLLFVPAALLLANGPDLPPAPDGLPTAAGEKRNEVVSTYNDARSAYDEIEGALQGLETQISDAWYWIDSLDPEYPGTVPDMERYDNYDMDPEDGVDSSGIMQALDGQYSLLSNHLYWQFIYNITTQGDEATDPDESLSAYSTGLMMAAYLLLTAETIVENAENATDELGGTLFLCQMEYDAWFAATKGDDPGDYYGGE